MAIPQPSSEDFLDRFPEFSREDQERIDLLLVEAARYVSDEWIQDHVGDAILYLTAHFIFSQNQTAKLYTGPAGLASGQVTSKSVGPLTINYSDPTKLAATGSSRSDSGVSLESSNYGLRYLELMRFSFPPIMMIV